MAKCNQLTSLPFKGLIGARCSAAAANRLSACLTASVSLGHKIAEHADGMNYRLSVCVAVTHTDYRTSAEQLLEYNLPDARYAVTISTRYYVRCAGDEPNIRLTAAGPVESSREFIGTSELFCCFILLFWYAWAQRWPGASWLNGLR